MHRLVDLFGGLAGRVHLQPARHRSDRCWPVHSSVFRHGGRKTSSSGVPWPKAARFRRKRMDETHVEHLVPPHPAPDRWFHPDARRACPRGQLDDRGVATSRSTPPAKRLVWATIPAPPTTRATFRCVPFVYAVRFVSNLLGQFAGRGEDQATHRLWPRFSCRPSTTH